MDMPDMDAAVAAAVLFQMSPPAIERPAFDWRQDVDRIRSDMVVAEQRTRAKLDAWVDASLAQQQSLAAAMAVGPVHQHHLEHLRRVALAIEEDTEQHVAAVRRQDKKLRRLIREVAALSPKSAEAYAEGIARVIAFAMEEADIRLQGALFFRAMYAQHLPDNETGVVIDDPRDVSRMLDEAMASV